MIRRSLRSSNGRQPGVLRGDIIEVVERAQNLQKAGKPSLASRLSPGRVLGRKVTVNEAVEAVHRDFKRFWVLIGRTRLISPTK